MLVDITPEEREVLCSLLQREIAELGPEIRHTDSWSYRDDLKAHKRSLQQLLQHLYLRSGAEISRT